MSDAPNGCRWCGADRQDHYQRWTAEAGRHGWTAPTDAQRLERMRARRTPSALGDTTP